MNQYILFVTPQAEPSTLPWQDELTNRHIVLLNADSAKQAVLFQKAYTFMMILIEIVHVDDHLLETVRIIREAESEATRLPILGLSHAPLNAQERSTLAQAGFNDVAGWNDPPDFMLWRVDMLAALGELRCFEQTRVDVTSLAHETRHRLHSLSQPLSAVQGRLQLMAARSNDKDPEAPDYQDLVTLIFAVSNEVLEIQQIHRKYSG